MPIRDDTLLSSTLVSTGPNNLLKGDDMVFFRRDLLHGIFNTNLFSRIFLNPSNYLEYVDLMAQWVVISSGEDGFCTWTISNEVKGATLEHWDAGLESMNRSSATVISDGKWQKRRMSVLN